jgi:ribosome maturation protein Sdo1
MWLASVAIQLNLNPLLSFLLAVRRSVVVGCTMSARMCLPHSQQRHSNVAVVRMAKGSKRIEIACYKNKVLSFRQGAETDLSEVVQIDRVFSSVARGEFASAIDIRHVIGEDLSESEAILHILRHGDVQIASGERNYTQEELLRDVCTIVAQKIVHPATKRNYDAVFIEDTLKAMGVNLRSDQPAKRNAVHVVKELCARQFIPAARAKMRLRMGTALGNLEKFDPSLVHEEADSVTVDIEPEHFRELMELGTAEGWSLEVIDYAVCDTSVGDASAFALASASSSKRAKRDARRLRLEACDSDSSD